jgi:hypothetical protein
MPAHLTRRTALSLGLGTLAAAALPQAAHANTVIFDQGWEHLTFRRLKPNTFTTGPNRLTSFIRRDLLNPVSHIAE